ncbi:MULTISPECIES: RAMP superfamily CRISPR-associated protein [unclassified Frankia]|uniref:RAMP superfamily CRISPR-associated protein n=1 Tax=unclassified Frankia TaxID=2632575 RepID=UPI002AD5AA54|nr:MULTISPECIES: RAMP superfamily CRISPR-associated protein [unclassified Frankia]
MTTTTRTRKAPVDGLALTLTLHLDSDWHCGTGLGVPGGVDKVINTDHGGLPFVPGKTLTGVWRDACELVAAALDGSTDPAGAAAGGWHAWVDVLFGSQPVLTDAAQPAQQAPRPAAVSVRPARYPDALAAALRPTARRPLRDATTFVRPGVKIDPRTGRAADAFLRFEQMARSGVQLTATATLAGWSDAGAGTGFDDDGRRAAAAVLLLGARLVESIGGKRRRGAGRCRLEVTEAAAPDPGDSPLPTLDSLVSWLRARNGVAPSIPPALAEAATAADPVRPGETGWEIIDLRLHLDTPLVVQDRTVGNAVRSLTFVPGSLLLPAILRRLGELPGWDPAGLARAGTLLVTNATIEVDGAAGRPLPRTWFHPKEDTDAAVNRLVDDPREPGAAAKPYKDSYVGATPAIPATDDAAPATVAVRRPERTIHTHNVIDDARQRPTSALVGLYTYQALAAGTVLRAQVRVRAGLLPQGADAALAGTWGLGRSAKDDYGQVSVTVDGPPKQLPASSGVLAGTDDKPKITVWLLSDVLIRDQRLRPSTDPVVFAEQLGAALDVQLTPAIGSSDDSDGLLRWVTATRRAESWQRSWCRPRPTLLGLAAGSVLTFTANRQPSPENLARVQAAGIGERTAEGFGQIAVDDPLLVLRPGRLDDGTGRADEDEAGSATPFVPPREKVAYAMAQVIEREAWRAHIQREAVAVAATSDGRSKILGLATNGKDSGVNPTQLGGLRDVLTRLEEDDEIAYWLNRLPADPWPVQVRTKVTQLLTKRSEVWPHLRLGPGSDKSVADKLIITDGGADRLRADTELWAEAVRTLVTNCLTAHRRALTNHSETTAETAGDVTR